MKGLHRVSLITLGAWRWFPSRSVVVHLDRSEIPLSFRRAWWYYPSRGVDGHRFLNMLRFGNALGGGSPRARWMATGFVWKPY